MVWLNEHMFLGHYLLCNNTFWPLEPHSYLASVMKPPVIWHFLSESSLSKRKSVNLSLPPFSLQLLENRNKIHQDLPNMTLYHLSSLLVKEFLSDASSPNCDEWILTILSLWPSSLMAMVISKLISLIMTFFLVPEGHLVEDAFLRYNVTEVWRKKPTTTYRHMSKMKQNNVSELKVPSLPPACRTNLVTQSKGQATPMGEISTSP